MNLGRYGNTVETSIYTGLLYLVLLSDMSTSSVSVVVCLLHTTLVGLGRPGRDTIRKPENLSGEFSRIENYFAMIKDSLRGKTGSENSFTDL